MSDIKIADLTALAAVDVASGDLLAIVDVSADETKKVTAADLIEASVDFLSSGAIPIAKVDTTGITLAADSVGSSQISTGAVGSDELATGSVTNAKLASGSLTADKFGTQSANTVLAGPIGGGAASPTFRALDPADLPLATTTTVGGVIVPTSGGLAVDVAGNVSISNSVTPGSFGWVNHDADGLITSSRALLGSDVPVATTSTRGTVAVNGSGLTMSGNEIRHSNSVTAANLGFVTYDAQGHVTAGRALIAGDLPVATTSAVGGISVGSGLNVTAGGAVSVAVGDSVTVGGYALGGQFTVNASNQLEINYISATYITGTISTSQIADDAVTGAKVANQATCKISATTPASGDYEGQLFYNSSSGSLQLWNGSSYQAISVTTTVDDGTY
jgi:hypothetical protein